MQARNSQLTKRQTVARLIAARNQSRSNEKANGDSQSKDVARRLGCRLDASNAVAFVYAVVQHIVSVVQCGWST